MIFIGIILCISCKSLPFSRTYPAFNYINYNKLKIEIDNNSINASIKGYMNFIPDSQICFRFWGLLGFEVGRGFFNTNQFIFLNKLNNEKVVNLKEQIQNISGCVVDLKALQYLLLGYINDFSTVINFLNPNLLEIKSIDKQNLVRTSITHKLNHTQIVIIHKFNKKFLKQIKFLIYSDNKKTSVVLNIVDISFERKMCNFVL